MPLNSHYLFILIFKIIKHPLSLLFCLYIFMCTNKCHKYFISKIQLRLVNYSCSHPFFPMFASLFCWRMPRNKNKFVFVFFSLFLKLYSISIFVMVMFYFHLLKYLCSIIHAVMQKKYSIAQKKFIFI